MALLDVLDEPDRSWIFWGVAILFAGVLLFGLGVSLITWGRQLIRASRSSLTG